MKLRAFRSHTPVNGEYQWSHGSVLNVHYSYVVIILLFSLMLRQQRSQWLRGLKCCVSVGNLHVEVGVLAVTPKFTGSHV